MTEADYRDLAEKHTKRELCEIIYAKIKLIDDYRTSLYKSYKEINHLKRQHQEELLLFLLGFILIELLTIIVGGIK